MKAFFTTVDPRKGQIGIHYPHEGEESISVPEGNVEMKVGEEETPSQRVKASIFIQPSAIN